MECVAVGREESCVSVLLEIGDQATLQRRIGRNNASWESY